MAERTRRESAAVDGRFAADDPITLSADEQADLALWAVTASLIAMSQDPRASDFADPDLARQIYRGRQPTRGIDVWLGANQHGEMGWFGSHSLTLRQAPAGHRAWGATISFGYAVIHIVCHDLLDRRMRLKGSAHRALRRIWGPRDRVAWPPKLRLQPHDATPLAQAVGEECSFERAVHRSV
jgi:hypothetical protein